MLVSHVRCLLLMIMPFIFVSITSAGSIFSPKGGEPAADGSLEAPARAVRGGRDAEALALLREAARTHTTWAPPRLVLARMQFAADLPAQARRSLEQAAAETPADPRIYLALGSLALNEGRYSDARLNGEKALSLLEGVKLDSESAGTIRREACAGLVAIDETGVGNEVRKAGCRCGASRQIQEGLREGRPRRLRLGIDGVVAIASAVGDPAERATVGHGDGHAEAAGRHHVAEGGFRRDGE